MVIDHPHADPAATPDPTATDSDDDRRADARAYLGEFYPDPGEGPGLVRLALNGPDGWNELTGFRADRDPFAGLVADHAEMLDVLAASLAAHAGEGLDVYASPYLHAGQRSLGGAVRRQYAHADIDGAVRLERARALGAMVVGSGSVTVEGEPHGHVYVRLSRPVTVDEHRVLCLALGCEVGGDAADVSKVGDADVLRVPGTLNQKSRPPRQVAWLIRPDNPSVRTWEPEELARLLGVDLDEPAPPVALGTDEHERDVAAGGAPARLDGLVRAVREAPGGQGNARLNWAAGRAAAIVATATDARPEAEVREALVDAYMQRPTTERPEARRREAESTVASGWRYGAANPAAALGDRRRDRVTVRPPVGVDLDQGVDPDGEPDATEVAEEHRERSAPDDAKPAARVAGFTPGLYVDVAALLAAGMPEPTRPEIARRSDGVGLFYSGQVNTIYGDPESGKSFVTKAAAAEVLGDGGSVLFVDLDHNGVHAIVGHLLAFGVPSEVLSSPARFRYADDADAEALRRIAREASAWTPTLVVIDSVGELLPIFGASSNDADDYSRVHGEAIKPFATAGAAVVLVDHMAKNATSREFGAGGTVAKKRAIGGVSLRCRVVDQFRPGHGGAAELFINKDRHGGLRAATPSTGGEPLAATFRLVNEPGGGLSWTLEAPTAATVPKTRTFGDQMADARALLERLGVPTGTGQRVARELAMDEVRRMRQAEEAVPDGLTAKLFERAQGERKVAASIGIVPAPTSPEEVA